MGLPDSYILPSNPLEALSLCGDGVVVPIVRFLVGRVLEPCLDGLAPGRGERRDARSMVGA
jgi:hypothetical protein